MGKNRSVAVGGFVLGGLALGVIAILLFGGTRLFASKVRVVVFFTDSVAGLSVGAPVTLRGVKVGVVQSMKVYLKLPELVPVIPVYLDIEPNMVSWTNGTLRADAEDVDIAVKAGLRAQLATQSLVTGQLNVNLDFHPEIPARMSGNAADAPEIPSIPSDLQKIKDEIADLRLSDLAEKARTALTGVDQVVGELSGKIGPLADSLVQTSDAARMSLQSATEALRQVQADASHALGNIDQLATSTQAQVAATGNKMADVLNSANKTLDQLNGLTDDRAPFRTGLEATVRDLAAAAASLRNFSKELERKPSTLLLGR